MYDLLELISESLIEVQKQLYFYIPAKNVLKIKLINMTQF